MEKFKFDTAESVIVTISHALLTDPFSGFASVAETTTGTKGVLIFIPTARQEALLDLIKI